MNYETLKFEIQNKIAYLVINRPDKLNALSETVLKELKSLIQILSQKRIGEIRGMIVTGEGEKSFIAGADIKAMNSMDASKAGDFSQLGQDVSLGFEQLPFPIIACVNGFALGGGCEMAMSCDFIYAVENALFGQPEVNLGLIPGFGGCVRLMQRVGPAKAKELIYTGKNIKAKEALDIGLVNKIFSTKHEMLEGAVKTLNEIDEKSPWAVSKCKQVINKNYGLSTVDALQIEKNGFMECFLSPDKEEGITAFLEKRKPKFRETNY